MIAKHNALVPWEQGVVGHKVEWLLREDKCVHKTLPTEAKCRPKESVEVA